MAVNRFADIDVRGPQMKAFKGYNKRMGFSGRRGQLNLGSDVSSNKKMFSYDPSVLKGLPDSVDWRDKGAVSPVKNQGMCGSCWAFSATESIESHLFLATGQMQILSPQNVLECTPNPKHCGGTGGCEGATHEVRIN
jgi:cathepsin L